MLKSKASGKRLKREEDVSQAGPSRSSKRIKHEEIAVPRSGEVVDLTLGQSLQR